MWKRVRKCREQEDAGHAPSRAAASPAHHASLRAGTPAALPASWVGRRNLQSPRSYKVSDPWHVQNNTFSPKVCFPSDISDAPNARYSPKFSSFVILSTQSSPAGILLVLILHGAGTSGPLRHHCPSQPVCSLHWKSQGHLQSQPNHQPCSHKQSLDKLYLLIL